jgi:LacI family transcriptional regulator
MKRISEMTGYSVATVSNALNHKRGVNNETSTRIIQAAQELGYINSAKISKIRFVTYKKNGLIKPPCYRERFLIQ